MARLLTVYNIKKLMDFSRVFAAGPTKGSGREKITCPVCKVDVVRRVYRRHYETMHCVQDPVPCQFCQKTFKHRYSLDCHQRQAHPLQRKKHQAQKKLKSKSSSSAENDWRKIPNGGVFVKCTAAGLFGLFPEHEKNVLFLLFFLALGAWNEADLY